MDYIETYFNRAKGIIDDLNKADVEAVVDLFAALKARKGRLFLLGIGGSAANASHAVNDFRKICGIETYAPTDNVSELTARANDDGWETIFINWLKVSQLTSNDLVMVFSVGGGNLEKNVSPNIVRALEYAQTVGTPISGVISRDGGYTRKVATASVLIPIPEADLITPLSESFQAVVWHLIATHPKLK